MLLNIGPTLFVFRFITKILKQGVVYNKLDEYTHRISMSVLFLQDTFADIRTKIANALDVLNE